MINKLIGKDHGYIIIWLPMFVFFMLMPCAALAVKVEVQPGNATGWRGSSTSFIYAVVSAGKGGSVWGSGPYTDDSSIPTAAVHSGALADGETGLVMISILPGQSSYTSSTRNGVTTNAYGSWYGSYSISRWNYDGTTIDDPINFASWGNMRGTLNVSLTGVSNGSIWGTDIYTSDSLLAKAAVHAGKLTVGQSAVVPVTLLDGLSSYAGSTRNGVSSNSWGSYGSSYSFGTTPTPTPTPTPMPTPTPIGCTATIDENLLLHIPYLTYVNPVLGSISLWAEFDYEFNPTSIIFRLTNANVINNPSFSCVASTLSNNLKIHIFDVLLPDKTTHLWLDLEYSSALSTNGNAYWVVSDYGFN